MRKRIRKHPYSYTGRAFGAGLAFGAGPKALIHTDGSTSCPAYVLVYLFGYAFVVPTSGLHKMKSGAPSGRNTPTRLRYTRQNWRSRARTSQGLPIRFDSKQIASTIRAGALRAPCDGFSSWIEEIKNGMLTPLGGPKKLSLYYQKHIYTVLGDDVASATLWSASFASKTVTHAERTLGTDGPTKWGHFGFKKPYASS